MVETLCKLPYDGINRERILQALAHKGYKKKGMFEHELRVVYELVQGNKLDKERLRVSRVSLMQVFTDASDCTLGVMHRASCCGISRRW